MKTDLNIKAIDFLKKELSFVDLAVSRLEGEMATYEKKYSMKWKDFLNKFEKGELGDDRVWFNWYALATSAKDWHDIKVELKKAIRTS